MGAKIKQPVKKSNTNPPRVRKNPSKIETSNNTINVNGHTLKLSNQDKVYWPKEKITKGQVLEYYNSISKYILPYLKDRPQSLKRNPNGITDKGFYHKDEGDAAPDWVQRIALYSESTNKDINYILCNDKATLLYLNNLGCIEINPWNSRVNHLDHPDYLVIDIDPSDSNSFDEVIDTALVLKEILDQAEVASYCKTSGATGLHIYVPLGSAYDYQQARSFAELVATLAQEQLPQTTTLERSLSKRKNRIYIDYLQNSRGQTLSSVYSLRPVPGASVSTPLAWKEVKQGLRPAQFNIQTLPRRLDKVGDLFNKVLKEKSNLQRALKRLGVD